MDRLITKAKTGWVVRWSDVEGGSLVPYKHMAGFMDKSANLDATINGYGTTYGDLLRDQVKIYAGAPSGVRFRRIP